MNRLLRQLDRVDASRRPSRVGRLRRTVGKRDGMLAVLITGGVVAAAVLVDPWWKDEIGSPYSDDHRVAAVDELSTVADRPTGPPLPPGVSPARILPEVTATTVGSHAFLGTSGGRPVGYDPCKIIRYVVNPAGAPAVGEELIREAVAEVSEATGLAFMFEGNTDERPVVDREVLVGSGSDAAWAPVLVAWSDEDEFGELAEDVAGVGGSSQIDLDTPTAHYVSGYVVLDGPDFAEILREPGGRAIAKSIVLHEFGHLVGLDHVDDSAELMVESTSDVTEFGPGDREGLAALGAQPCFTSS